MAPTINLSPWETGTPLQQVLLIAHALRGEPVIVVERCGNTTQRKSLPCQKRDYTFTGSRNQRAHMCISNSRAEKGEACSHAPTFAGSLSSVLRAHTANQWLNSSALDAPTEARETIVTCTKSNKAQLFLHITGIMPNYLLATKQGVQGCAFIYNS